MKSESAMRALSVAAFCIAVSMFAGAAYAKKSTTPDWLEDAMKGEVPYERFEGKNDALVLLDECNRILDSKGNSESHFRYAVHIDSRDARRYGVAMIPVSSKDVKLSKFEAWIIYPSGKIETFGKRDLIEVASEFDSLYSESSMLVLDRSYSMRDGAVFAYEYEIEKRALFLDDLWRFQAEVPVLQSRYTVELPEGWEIIGTVMNGIPVAYDRSQGLYSWSANDIPALKDETNRPPMLAILGFLGVSIFPDEKSISRYGYRTFRDWNDVASFGESVQWESLPPSREIEAKVQELTTGLQTKWEKVKAICEYAQSVNYVSVAMDLETGGGYRPRPAEFVFNKHYGDCKDMTVLARSMLGLIGVEPYAIVASIGGESYVHDGWPSPHQFNHCILGVRADDAFECDAIVKHPQLGRTLIFDPTRKFTPFGKIPDSLQGTKVLVCHDDVRSLIELPVNDPDRNSTKRLVTVSVDESGNLSGTIEERVNGNLAVYLRMLTRSLSSEDLNDSFKRWIANGTREAEIGSVSYEDDLESNESVLNVTFSAPRYARKLGNKMILNPVFLSRRDWTPPKSEERTSDYVFEPWVMEERIDLSYPEQYTVESKKKGTAITSDYVEYFIDIATPSDRQLEVSRRYHTGNARVPATEYERIVSIFEDIARADAGQVVLTLAD